MQARVRVQRQAAKDALRAMGLDSESEEDDVETASIDSESEGSEGSDESSINEDDGNLAWEPVLPGQDRRPNPVPEFLGTPGVSPTFQIPADVETGRSVILEQFLNSELIEKLQSWTNVRVEHEVAKFREEDRELPSGLKTWKPCTADEMRKLIGTLLYTGTTYKPELASYWSTDPYHYMPYLHKPESQFGLGVAPVELSLSERIVVELSRDLLNLGYRVYCDSWFTSVRLANFMLLNGTTVTGTVRKERGVPQDLTQQKLNPPSNAFMRCGDALVVKIVDRRSSGVKTVYMLDTAGTAECSLVSRTVRGGQEQHLMKPKTVLAYNRHMGGVDRLDAACQPYSPCRRTYKWFTKLALHLVLHLVRNSWLVYRHLGGTCSFLNFIDFTVQHLIESSGTGRARVHLVLDPVGAAAQGAHFPMKLPPSETQQHPTKRCRMCHRQGRRKRTVLCCNACPGQPGLCLSGCFAAWHQEN